MIARRCWIALVCLIFAGCAKTHHDEDWTFDEVAADLSREQVLEIASDPPAELFATAPGGDAEKHIGRTPCVLTCRYAVAEVRLHRDAYQTRLGLFRKELGPIERVAAAAVHAPEGDFRDWAEIDEWAGHIDEELRQLAHT